VKFLTASAGNNPAPLELEFYFVQENECGDIISFEGLDGQVFACHDKSCAPPPIGTGGSKPSAGGSIGTPSNSHYAPKGKYIGSAEHESDLAVVTGRGSGSVRSDGILSEPWLDDDGNVVLTAKQEAAARKALENMGTSYEEWVANVRQVAVNSMEANPEQALRDSKWYSHEHDSWGAPLAKDHNITVDQVMGIASAVSTNKVWDGIKNSNKEVVERILTLLKEDKPITITPEQADAYNQFSVDKPKGGGKYGPRSIEPGEYKLSELSSGTLARVMGSGYGIGGQYFTDGLFKAFSIARGELEPNAAIGSLKQRSFVNNLVHPDKDYSSTNDFWMARALFGSKTLNITKEGGTGAMTIREWEQHTGNKPNAFLGTKGTGNSSLFAMGTKAAKEALADLAGQDERFRGMLTHEFQALVWVQMQREYATRGWESE
jgi:hypothetical protein